MSNILEMLQSQLSGDALNQLTKQIGGNEAQTKAAIETAVPAMLKALSKNAASPEGAKSLASTLDKNHDGSVLNDLMGFFAQGNDTNGGSGILKHLFGQKQSAVEQAISKNSGLNSTATSNLMTQLAPIVMGFLGQQKKQGGLDVSSIANLVMNQFTGAKQQSKTSNSALDMLSGLIDKDGDGMQDELMDMGKKLLGGFFGKK